MSQHAAAKMIEGEVTYTIPDFDSVDAFGRLLLGISLEGIDQFFARLKQLEESLYDGSDYANVATSETPVDQLRYLFVGALFLSQKRVRRRIGQTLRVVGVLGGLVRPIAQRVSDNWFVKQGKGLISAEVERLISEGRLQEKNARRIAHNLFGASIDEVVAQLQHKQSLDLLLEQSIHFNNIGSQSAQRTAALLDDLATSILEKLNVGHA